MKATLASPSAARVLVLVCALACAGTARVWASGWFEAVSVGLPTEGSWAGVAWGDYDRDGDEDLFVAGAEGGGRLYRNRGDGTFEETAGALPPGTGSLHGCAWGTTTMTVGPTCSSGFAVAGTICCTTTDGTGPSNV
ncbi:MAG: VCBS repeat-containing protein [Verrucomicrobia bacterium]|nr:VCBS repeat-containing protein [Verrucomicrobiota bacterium]